MLSTTWASCSSKRDLPDEQRDHTRGKNTPDCRDKDAQCSIVTWELKSVGSKYSVTLVTFYVQS